MTSFVDDELGEIIVRRRNNVRNLRIRLGTDGRYIVYAPNLTPVLYIKKTIKDSRENLKKMRLSVCSNIYNDKQSIGKNHKIAVIKTGLISKPEVKLQKQLLLVYIPPSHNISDTEVQQQIRDYVAKILRKEAKEYLPRRIKYLAERYDFGYSSVRFSHACSRWGSCSSSKKISLNIALMKLPDELIDYVLIHELSHTIHMNHSKKFWAEVERCDPKYKLHKASLKNESPVI